MRKSILLTLTTLCLAATATLPLTGKGSANGLLRNDENAEEGFTSTFSIFSVPQIPITTCVEVPATVVNESRRRKSVRTDCSPSHARTLALNQSRVNARDALAPTCRAQITLAEAQAVCADRNMTVVTSSGAASLQRFLAVQGGEEVDSTLTLQPAGNPKKCVVLRNLEDEFESSTQADGICVFDGFRRTIFTARSRARCGVQCR